jgi:hypothetical protein
MLIIYIILNDLNTLPLSQVSVTSPAEKSNILTFIKYIYKKLLIFMVYN